MKLKTVTWYDAIKRSVDSILLEEFFKVCSFSSGKDLLAVNTTYGKVKELKDVVIVITEESTDSDTDVVVIPKEWVISIK